MNYPECPYCGHAQEINHDDGYGYDEGEVYHQECSLCGSIFAYTTSITFEYDLLPAPCMNESDGDYGNHQWEVRRTYKADGSVFKRYKICTICGERMDL